jgi:MoxR-like ATPase
MNPELPSFQYTAPDPNARIKRGQEPYLPSPELVEAINLAIALRRPLLIKGEPGCGKTRLAPAVARQLGLEFKSWSIKSTSRARDGLYLYDAVGRLRAAQLAAAGKLLPEAELAKLADPSAYIKWMPLGLAFRSDRPMVVLIDEIDKADIDFPNDLLLELDERRFVVDETGDVFEAKHAPIIFITSNDEKDLPDAFLRRCLFHYIEFPDEMRLVQIVRAHFPDDSRRLIDAVVQRFIALRRDMQGKKVSTSELIDWFTVLRRHPRDEVLQKLEGRLPYLSVLLKSWEDHRRYLAGLAHQKGAAKARA